MESIDIDGSIPETFEILRDISLSRIFDEVTFAEYALLKIIFSLAQKSESGTAYVSQVAKRLKKSAPAVSKALRILEAKGLVIRETDLENRRKTFVSLTDKGCAAKADADKAFIRFFNGVYKKVGKDDMEKFNLLAKKISAVIVEELCTIKK